MPEKNFTATESVTAAPVRATKPKTTKTSPVAEVVTQSRVKTVKHSKAAAPVAIAEITETVASSAHDQIAKIAYGYWEARGFQPGSPEQDWVRAEQAYLQQAASLLNTSAERPEGVPESQPDWQAPESGSSFVRRLQPNHITLFAIIPF